MVCPCGGSGSRTIYAGQIRSGPFGTFTKTDFKVVRCILCGLDRLDPQPIEPDAYASGAYREMVDGSSDTAHYYRTHDRELSGRLELVGSADLRGKVVMDVGCGAGAFLDVLIGLAARTIGVEPQRNFGASLKAKRHEHYANARDLAAEFPGSVDVAVSFQVIEHVENPQAFLADVAECLKPGGRLHLTTPNRDDILMIVGPESYRSFFYRVAHLWYFDPNSLRRICETCGLKVVALSTPHYYDLSNFAVWLRDQRPRGLGALPDLSGPADAAFRSQVAASGHGDRIYATLEKPL
jgi:2-polyprenyl-3-methyl-5-hydroxy-6-metoxy-1,4-benzoquinol methylase